MVAKKKYQHNLVEVMWIDAETGHGWEEEGETDIELPLATTVGFMVRETADAYLIASTYSGTSTNARIKVPKGMVKNFKILK